MTDQKILDILAFLYNVPTDTIEEMDCDHYGLTMYEVDGEEVAAGTYEQAMLAAEECIKDSLWAFNPSFLAGETEIPEEVFVALQPRCEDSNDAVLKLVEATCGLDHLVAEAIGADGLGHFLSPYDGEEREHEGLYVFRIN